MANAVLNKTVNLMKWAMKPLHTHLSMASLLVALLAVAGCGGDGNNASDNAISAPILIPSGGSEEGGTVAPLPEAGAPLALNSDVSGDVESARAVVDGSGNVTTVWTQSDGAKISLWASRYNNGVGWSNALKLESGALDVKGFQLVIDASGNVTVVWSQASADFYMSGSTRIDVERTDLWATRYIANAGWDLEQRIESADLSANTTQNIEDIGEIELGVDSLGNVTALWTQHNGGGYDLYARRHQSGAWEAAPVLLDSEGLGDAETPKLLVDSSGGAFVLWVQSDGTYLNLWGARYAAGWSVATKLDSEDLGDVERPTAVVDAAGVATVAWRQFNGNRWNLWVTRHSGSWDAPLNIDVMDGDVDMPHLQLYGTNNVMLFWGQSNGAVNRVWTSYYSGGWSTNFAISDSGSDAGSVSTVQDSAGSITTIWLQKDSTASNAVYSLWSRYFSSGTWESPVLLETGASGDVRSPILLTDSARRASVIWLQEDDAGRFDIWSNHHSLGKWRGAQLVEHLDDGSAIDPRAVMAGNGNITLVWRTPYDSSNQLVTSKYTAGTNAGWGAVAKIGSPIHNNGYNPIPLVDGDGVVTVVWLQPVTDGKNNRLDLWASHF